jgi:glutamate decarboxylase
MLINEGIEKAQYFAQLINQHDDFELISKPELCLLTYRYVPKNIQQFLGKANKKQQQAINDLLDTLTKSIQKRQRENGKSFVSRTRIESVRYQSAKVLVFRVVLANPLTSQEILSNVLVEQTELAQDKKDLLTQLQALIY